MAAATTEAQKHGKITQVIGPVVDVEFPPGALPEIYTALLLTNPSISEERDNITMPVGKEVLGRILNVVGQPVDEKGPLKVTKRLPIHRLPPTFTELDVRME